MEMENGTKGFLVGLVVGVFIVVVFLNMPLNEFIKFYVYGVCAASIISIISLIAGSIANSHKYNKNTLNKNNQTTPIKEFKKRKINFKLTMVINLFSWIGASYLLILAFIDIIKSFQKKPVKIKINFE